jgi:hypothetical protein
MTQYGVFKQPLLTWNGVTLTGHVTSVNFSSSIDGLEDTESGDTTKTEAPGLIVNSMDVEFNQDFAASGAGSIDATLGAGIFARTVGAWVYQHDSGAKSTTNPQYTASAFIKSYTPTSGPIGSLSKARVTFGFTTAVTRDAS